VLFAMYERALWNRPYVKCARVSARLGKYHPHGDTTTYDACADGAGIFRCVTR